MGDYDNDGYEDLFICSAGKNVLYHNNGNGTFTDVTAASGIGGKPPNTLSVVAAWFDYDNDGLLDLIVDNYTFWTPETDLRCTMDNKEDYCDPRRYPSVEFAPVGISIVTAIASPAISRLSNRQWVVPQTDGVIPRGQGDATLVTRF